MCKNEVGSAEHALHTISKFQFVSYLAIDKLRSLGYALATFSYYAVALYDSKVRPEQEV